ncbi:hypothetical protein FNF27_00288 [Cafeteria roenbergensis]|uniref:arginyltransferase n=1 Tax=Cafeteria roenbergensis TaxID=33653 RepID=A0A5A8ELF0_CAFRO|nr:hypothetical protein FNF27_00288 [Cafeteria roenbergensis]
MASAAEFEDWAPVYCRELSAVQPLGDHESKCGYCSSPDGFSTFGALTRRLTCTDYQALIDHNWRRSGTYMYRPNQDATCCPLLTIRLDVEVFRASKQQNQLLRRMQRFLDGEIDLLGPAGGEDERGAASCKDEAAKPAPENAAQSAAVRLNAALAAAVNAAVDAGSLPSALRGAVLADGPTGSHPDITIRPAARAAAPAAAAARAAAAGGAVPAFSSPVAMRLAALARRAGGAAPSAGEVASAVAAAWAGSAACAAVAAAAVSERGPPFINFTLTDADVLAELAADSADSQRQPDRSAVSDAAGRAQGETSSSSPRKRRMRVVAAPAVFEQESFELYKRYQKAVHGDKEKDLTVKQYTGFLCESPLVPMPLDSDAKGYADAAVGLVRSRSGAPEDLCRLALAVTASADDAAGLLEASRGRLSDDQMRSRLREAASAGVGGYAQAAVRALREARRAGEGSGAGFPAKAEGSPLAAAGSDAAAAAGTAAGGAAAGGAAAGTAAGSGAAAAAGAASTAEPADVVGTLSGFGPGAVAHGLGAADAEGGTALAGGYGSYHHKYYLDDQLVAVGVVDVLPNCLSSVYVFYDPDMPRLQLGRYTALREIQWVQAAHARLPRLRYYYMGYYVHSCQKMRYKADYKPSELLCPVTGRWVHHHEAKPILDKHRFARIAVAEGEGPKDGPAGAASDGAAAEECRTCAERRASVAHMVPAADPAADAAASAWAERVPLLLVRAKQDCVVGNLTASGQSIVRPLLAQFAKLAPQAVADRSLAYF